MLASVFVSTDLVDVEVTISSIESVYQPFVFLLTTCVQWARCCVWGQQ